MSINSGHWKHPRLLYAGAWSFVHGKRKRGIDGTTAASACLENTFKHMAMLCVTMLPSVKNTTISNILLRSNNSVDQVWPSGSCCKAGASAQVAVTAAGTCSAWTWSKTVIGRQSQLWSLQRLLACQLSQGRFRHSRCHPRRPSCNANAPRRWHPGATHTLKSLWPGEEQIQMLTQAPFRQSSQGT